MPQHPVIVLVNTQLPENIGAAARAMMNFGLTELRLVAPRDGWPNQRAWDLAAHAGEILDNAKIYATTAEAVADRKRVYAATARPREMIKQVLSPLEGAEIMRSQEEVPTAILFGPERTGLNNDDVTLADTIITIPTGSTLASLNIAQSVVVIAYQWFVADMPENNPTVSRGTTGPLASPLAVKEEYANKEDLQHFFTRLERELDEADYWKVEHKKAKMWLNLRNIFTRVNLTQNEVRTLQGVISALKDGPKRSG